MPSKIVNKFQLRTYIKNKSSEDDLILQTCPQLQIHSAPLQLSSLQNRKESIEKLMNFCTKNKVSLKILVNAVVLTDIIVRNNTKKFNSILLGCFSLSNKFFSEQFNQIPIEAIQNLIRPEISIRVMEIYCLKKLNYNLVPITPLNYIEKFFTFSNINPSNRIIEISLVLVLKFLKKFIYNIDHCIYLSTSAIEKAFKNLQIDYSDKEIKNFFSYCSKNFDSEFYQKISEEVNKNEKSKFITSHRKTKKISSNTIRETYRNYSNEKSFLNSFIQSNIISYNNSIKKSTKAASSNDSTKISSKISSKTTPEIPFEAPKKTINIRRLDPKPEGRNKKNSLDFNKYVINSRGLNVFSVCNAIRKNKKSLSITANRL